MDDSSKGKINDLDTAPNAAIPKRPPILLHLTDITSVIENLSECFFMHISAVRINI